MKINPAIVHLVDQARLADRDALLETEGLALLDAIGIRTPRSVFVESAAQITDEALAKLGSDRLVVKVVAAGILHKSDVGGVAVVEHGLDAVRASIETMEGGFGHEATGYLLSEFIRYDSAPGGELLIGLRWTDDFGPVLVLGPGGIHSEFLSRHMRGGVVICEAEGGTITAAIARSTAAELATGTMRGQRARVEASRLNDTVVRVADLARYTPDLIREFEINPLVIADGDLVALDVLVKLGDGTRPERPGRPLHKLANLLSPQSVAVMGVSQRMNPGHVILNNLLRDGFTRERIYVIKPGVESLEGCVCVPDIASLPERVDLLVLSVDAVGAATAVTDIVAYEKAESVIVIPGGLDEKKGTEAVVSRMHESLAASRNTTWGGPLLNGGNCLGIISRPGRYDTMFIPEYKRGKSADVGAVTALLSQSGAFAVSKNNKLARVSKKYSISIGNQMDLTIGDYLEHLQDDEEISVFALYVEGFKPLDGKKCLDAARRITDGGRTVVMYAAGRSAEGARASASHTASIAGDYEVTRQLAGEAGIVVADSLSDFEDLVRMFSFLHGKHTGRRMGAISNAGFECVAIADNIGDLVLPPLEAGTNEAIEAILESARLSAIVDVNNPVDLTPIMGDAHYEGVVAAVAGDRNVDTVLVGCVPLTPALNTLPTEIAAGEDVHSDESVASRIVRLAGQSAKAFVAIVDAGEMYDAMAEVLESGGIPTFRTADRALRLLNIFYGSRTA